MVKVTFEVLVNNHGTVVLNSSHRDWSLSVMRQSGNHVELRTIECDGSDEKAFEEACNNGALWSRTMRFEHL